MIWVVYAIGLVILSFGISGDYSFLPQSVFSIYNLTIVLFALFIFVRTILENSTNNINWLKRSLILSIGMVLAYFIYKNSIAHKIIFDSNFNDSPFDQWWFSCSQTWYGYPGPFFRVLLGESQEFGKYIFDFSSLTINLVIFMFVNYLLTGMNLLAQFIILEHRKEKHTTT